MRNENEAVRSLRDDLEFTTERLPPDQHFAAFEKLRNRHPHSIEFFTDGTNGPHGYNCFMYALSVREFPASLVDVCRRVDAAYMGAAFVTELLDARLLKAINDGEAPVGSIAIWFNDLEMPQHAGILSEEQLLTSKWGTGHVWRHPPFETPTRYGEEVRFYEAPMPSEVLRRFKVYVERVSGLRVQLGDGVD